jgi:hypothetical protein
MSESASIHDFEEWYRCWYSYTRSNSSGYIIDSSVKEELRNGDEIVVYACLRQNKDMSLKRMCLIKELIDKSTERNINKLIKIQKDLYGVNDESGFNLIIQKLIIAYDLSQSLRTGRVYSSFHYNRNKSDSNLNGEEYENDKNANDRPLWNL